jgi:hypothetical protein
MSSLQNKMKNYEVVPPANAWDKIVAALDESSSGNEFPSKLYNAEAAPPAAAWENIKAALEPEEARLVPLKRKTPGFIRYAAAAILIGIAAFGVIRLTSGTSNNNNTVAINPTDTSVNRNTAKSDNTPVQEEQPIPLPDQRDLAAQPEQVSRKYPGKSNTPQIALYTYDPADDLRLNPIYDYGEPATNVVDRYIMLMTPEGNIIRMSKKLGNLVCCVSGEEQDDDCKTQIKKWQEKLATSPADASSGNFLDILTLMNSLEEGAEL